MKPFKTLILSLSLVTALGASVSAPAVMAATVDSTQVKELKEKYNQWNKTVADIDKDIVKKSKEEIKKFVDKEIELYDVQEYTLEKAITGYLIASKNYRIAEKFTNEPELIWEALIDLNAKGKVTRIVVDAKLATLDKDTNSHLARYLKELSGAQNMTLDHIDSYTWFDTGDMIANGKNIEIGIDKNGTMTHGFIYGFTTSQVDPKLVKRAEQAIMDVTGKPIKFGKLSRSMDQWAFADSDLHNKVVSVDVKSGKVISVFLADEMVKLESDEEWKQAFAKPKYTQEQAIKAVSPFTKKLFNIDLSGYQLKVKDNSYTFTKKGSPTIETNINEKGKFYSFDLKSE